MAGETNTTQEFKIGHVLFIDIVGYSKLSIEEQREAVEQLSQIVRETEQFCSAAEAEELVSLPAGDGMALVFSTTVEAPVYCALEIARKLKGHSGLPVRMGIHSGPVSGVTDVNARSNVAGAGINFAQRVMDRGDAGHILLSKHVADDLEQYRHWRPHLHDLGECEVKHGKKLTIVNFYNHEIGNSAVPTKLRKQTLNVGDHRKSNKHVYFIMAVAAIAATTALLTHRRPGLILDKSIAVLAFENLSDSRENAYFAGGIHEDVLTNLAKIGDLKVIARTSVLPFGARPRDLREVGKQLGVASILEGSVRRVGNRVRVSVQLINAANNQHIWAEDYDRELTDVFAIQSDLALQIASSLQTRLSSTEKTRLNQRPTANGEAYLLYLQARDVAAQGNLERAVVLYEQSIQLDPNFALAFAQLSYLESILYRSTGDQTHSEKAHMAAEEALRLQPSLPEAHLALGFNYYRANNDYGNALRELTLAAVGLPNDSEIWLVVGSIERRQGKWNESTKHLEKAASLNPKRSFLWANLGMNYCALRNFAEAAKCFERGVSAESSFFITRWLLARVEFERAGDLAPMERLLGNVKSDPDIDGQITLARVELKWLQRKYDEALAILLNSSVERFSPWQVPTAVPRSLLVALTYRFLNDPSHAQQSFDEAKTLLEQAVQENPTDPSRHALLAQAYAGLKRPEDAEREAKRAVDLLPESSDAFDGPRMNLALAITYALLGKNSEALPLVRHSLASPNGISCHELRINPVWEALRDDSRFEATCESPPP